MDGQIKNPNLQPCPEAVSAVKALQIATQQGQKIFTITPQNADKALPKLGLRGSVGEEVRIAVAMGKEVTIHEKAIHAHGWSGYGYMIVDPETGAGAYLIEGKGNGGYLDWWQENGIYIGFILGFTAFVGAVAGIATVLTVILAVISIFVALMNILVMEILAMENGCPSLGDLGFGLEVVALAISFFGPAGVAISAWLSFFTNGAINASVGACKDLQT